MEWDGAWGWEVARQCLSRSMAWNEMDHKFEWSVESGIVAVVLYPWLVSHTRSQSQENEPLWRTESLHSATYLRARVPPLNFLTVMWLTSSLPFCPLLAAAAAAAAFQPYATLPQLLTGQNVRVSLCGLEIFSQSSNLFQIFWVNFLPSVCLLVSIRCIGGPTLSVRHAVHDFFMWMSVGRTWSDRLMNQNRWSVWSNKRVKLLGIPTGPFS